MIDGGASGMNGVPMRSLLPCFGIFAITACSSAPTPGDLSYVEDPNAPPIWARFYELGTNRPFFSSRCEVAECEDDPYFMVRYSLAEIENERRVGYSWYGSWPQSLLTADYPAWKERTGTP